MLYPALDVGHRCVAVFVPNIGAIQDYKTAMGRESPQAKHG